MIKSTGRVKQIIDGLTRQPYKFSDVVGFKAEDKVVKMLNFFAKKGVIEKAKHTERFSHADKEGKDIEVLLVGGKTIFIQVTASYHKEDEDVSQRKNINYVHIRPDDQQKLLYNRLRDLIFAAYMGLHNSGRQIYLFKKVVPILTDEFTEEMCLLDKLKSWLKKMSVILIKRQK